MKAIIRLCLCVFVLAGCAVHDDVADVVEGLQEPTSRPTALAGQAQDLIQPTEGWATASPIPAKKAVTNPSEARSDEITRLINQDLAATLQPASVRHVASLGIVPGSVQNTAYTHIVVLRGLDYAGVSQHVAYLVPAQGAPVAAGIFSDQFPYAPFETLAIEIGTARFLVGVVDESIPASEDLVFFQRQVFEDQPGDPDDTIRPVRIEQGVFVLLIKAPDYEAWKGLKRVIITHSNNPDHNPAYDQTYPGTAMIDDYFWTRIDG